MRQRRAAAARLGRPAAVRCDLQAPSGRWPSPPHFRRCGWTAAAAAARTASRQVHRSTSMGRHCCGICTHVVIAGCRCESACSTFHIPADHSDHGVAQGIQLQGKHNVMRGGGAGNVVMCAHCGIMATNNLLSVVVSWQVVGTCRTHQPTNSAARAANHVKAHGGMGSVYCLGQSCLQR